MQKRDNLKEKQVKEFDFDVKILSESDEDYDEKVFRFEGFASTFGNVDRDGDIIMPGAFKETIRDMTPKLLWQHDMREVIGKFDYIEERDGGLYVKGSMPLDDDFVRGRVVPQMRHGSLNQMSIGFNIVNSERRSDGIREIEKVKLWEVSLVTIPANPMANVTAMKSLNSMSMDMETKAENGDYTIVKEGVIIFDAAVNVAKSMLGFGESAEFPDGTKEEIEQIYKTAGFVSPFSDPNGFVDQNMVEKMTSREIEKALRQGARFSRDAAKAALSQRDVAANNSQQREADDTLSEIIKDLNQMTANLKGKSNG